MLQPKLLHQIRREEQMSREVFTAKMIFDMAKGCPEAKAVTLHSMADGSVGTINYRGNLYEVRVTPVAQGIEKWAHPKTKGKR